MVSAVTSVYPQSARPESGLQSGPMERPAQPAKNVGEAERIASVITGSLLVAAGVKRMSIPGLVAAGLGVHLVRRGISGHCALYQMLNVTTEEEDPNKSLTHPLRQHFKVTRTITVLKPVEEVYAFVRDMSKFPQYMPHIESVTETDGGRSHWVARGPGGMQMEWDGQIINEIPNQLIAWRSAEGSPIDQQGQVELMKASEAEDRGTVVRVTLSYSPPAGVVGALLSKLFGADPAQQAKDGLRRMKHILETGEVPTIDGQPYGTCGG